MSRPFNYQAKGAPTVQDYTWARLGMADYEVELYLHSDFPKWNLAYNEIQASLIQALNDLGVYPKWVGIIC